MALPQLSWVAKSGLMGQRKAQEVLRGDARGERSRAREDVGGVHQGDHELCTRGQDRVLLRLGLSP